MNSIIVICRYMYKELDFILWYSSSVFFLFWFWSFHYFYYSQIIKYSWKIKISIKKTPLNSWRNASLISSIFIYIFLCVSNLIIWNSKPLFLNKKVLILLRKLALSIICKLLQLKESQQLHGLLILKMEMDPSQKERKEKLMQHLP